ncbi:MAG TPA: TolC family protein, partial [Desulfobaccales bacterium]|nr:TolC family protein [Desulfobaccales bacterium]
VYRLALLNRQLAVARKEERALRKNVATLQKALNLGDVTVVSLSAAQATWQKVHTQVLTIKQQRDQERLALNQVLGLPPEQRLPLAAHLGLTSSRPLPSLRDLTKNMQSRRLDLVALRMGYRSQEERVREAILAQIPKITIGFTHGSDTTHVISSGFTVAIDLPIFNRNQGNIAIQRATRQQLFDEYLSRLFTARADAARLRVNLASLRQQIASTRQSIQTLKRLVRTYHHALLEGNADVLTYYNARDTLISLTLDLITLKRHLADQRIALEIAAGEYLENQPNKAGPS